MNGASFTKDGMGMGVFRLDTFNPVPSLTLVNEAPFTKGRGLARPEQAAEKLLCVSLRAHIAFSRERSAAGSNLRLQAIDDLEIASSPTAPRQDSLSDFFSNLLVRESGQHRP